VKIHRFKRSCFKIFSLKDNDHGIVMEKFGQKRRRFYLKRGAGEDIVSLKEQCKLSRYSTGIISRKVSESQMRLMEERSLIYQDWALKKDDAQSLKFDQDHLNDIAFKFPTIFTEADQQPWGLILRECLMYSIPSVKLTKCIERSLVEDQTKPQPSVPIRSTSKSPVKKGRRINNGPNTITSRPLSFVSPPTTSKDTTTSVGSGGDVDLLLSPPRVRRESNNTRLHDDDGDDDDSVRRTGDEGNDDEDDEDDGYVGGQGLDDGGSNDVGDDGNDNDDDDSDDEDYFVEQDQDEEEGEE